MSRKHRASRIHPIVRQIIDRDCHVGISNRAVIRHVISKLRDGSRTFRRMPKEQRRELMRQCIARHRQNWEEYVNVMGGWTSLSTVHPAFRKKGGKK